MPLVPRPSMAPPHHYSLRLCLFPLVPRLPAARCIQLRMRATTHSPSRIVTRQLQAPGRRGVFGVMDGAGLSLTPPGLGQQQEAQAWAVSQFHHNFS